MKVKNMFCKLKKSTVTNSSIFTLKLLRLSGVTFLILVYTIATNALYGQHNEYNLSKLVASDKISIMNRTISSLEDNLAVRISEQEGPGVAWIDDLEFSTGTISIDLKGKDIKQGSFLGVAFHGNSSGYQAIYFRPFNFLAKEAQSRNHSVQYISLPKYDWGYLRETFPGVYENKIASPPDPNSWFNVTISVKENEITVFVNDAEQPSLVVEPKESSGSGKIGLWVGNSSGGDFANLKLLSISSKKKSK